MRQPWPVAIALRYLRARTQSAFISFISAVSMLGIALSVAVLIVVMSVVNGFETELERSILSISPDARILGYAGGAEAPLANWSALREAVLERDDVRAAAPFVEGQGMLHAGDRLLGVNVTGVDPALYREVSSLHEHIVAGDYASLEANDRIVIGRALAEALDLAIGDDVTLLLPEIRVTPAGVAPRLKVFRVGGIFDVGMAEFDRGLALVGFDIATRLYRTAGRASGIGLDVADVYEAQSIVVNAAGTAMARFDENYIPEDWTFSHANVFRSIEITKPLLFIVLSLVMAIAAFNIVSTLFMVVREKRGDIAILRTIGSGPRDILGIFFVQGSSIGLIGMVLGLALGLALAASLGSIVGLVEDAFGIVLWSADVYPVSELPSEARAGEVLGICALAFGLAVLAAIYPAYRASREPPAEALRYE